MHVLIIENEYPAAEKLKQLLQKTGETMVVTQVLETVEDSINWLKNNSLPDLIFMDIQLDDGICFEIFDQVKLEIPVIFTTAYDEYAIRAFKVNSIDYLLKPIELNALISAIDKYKVLHRMPTIEPEIMKTIYQGFGNRYKERFFVQIGTRYFSIRTDQVECFYINERCTFLQTFEPKRFDLDFSLDQIQRLVNPNQFFRINRNFLINFASIVQIHLFSSSRLKVEIQNQDPKEEILVSREKVTDFKAWLDR